LINTASGVNRAIWALGLRNPFTFALLPDGRRDWAFPSRKENKTMAYSSILGSDVAPTNPSGRGADLLGPSDNSDTGSDTIGTHEAYEDSDASGTGERGAVAGADGREGGDILPDRVVNLADDEGFPQADVDAMELTDLDNDDVEALADRDASGEDR
jgi:hypothetical protein